MTFTKSQRLEQARFAREWREECGFSRQALAELTGYSASMIQDLELGEFRGKGIPMKETDYQKYRLACAAIENNLRNWNWGYEFEK